MTVTIHSKFKPKMTLPPELTSTDTTTIPLEDGSVVTLPVCHPTFTLWKGAPVSFDYGSKPILNYNNEACFAELVILKTLLADGWDGVWVETYGGTHYLRSMPDGWAVKSGRMTIPADKEAILKKIRESARTTACFDVFAWKGDDILLCEAKCAGKDKLTDAQIRFIKGALKCGTAPESLLIAEWSAH